MPVRHLLAEELTAVAGRAPTGADPADPRTVLVVDLDVAGSRAVVGWPSAAPTGVVVGTTTGDPDAHVDAPGCDVVLVAGAPELDAIVATVEANPLSATSLALLLRGSEGRSVEDGLLAESAVYSTLQAGPEFARWRAGRPVRHHADHDPPVVVRRDREALHVTLHRPAVRNALSVAMRDALLEALDVARCDPSITEVHLAGDGPSFCSGGDLDEFGSFPDPATAHLIRLDRSIGRVLHAITDRVVAHVHGPCAGSGVELPAFAHRVVADPATTFTLPEVSLGLVPGAGGTVSLPRRIGRHRTARLALTGEVLSASTALAWGLVDEIAERDQAGAPG